MAKAAKAPPKKTNPVFVAGGVGLAAIAWLVLNPADSGPSPSSTSRPKKRATAKDTSGFTPADEAALKNPFPPVIAGAVDAFNPLIKKQQVKAVPTLPRIPEGGTAGMVPANLADGESNWYFTGAPQLNGVTQAVLENTVTNESVVLQPGQTFKSARLQSVDVSTVVLVGPSGSAVSVPIQGYGEVPGGKTAVAANGPLPLPGVPLSGPIGGTPGTISVQPATGPQTITLSNGQTLQLAPAAPAGNDNPGNGRRRRRNRQNLGNSDNGL